METQIGYIYAINDDGSLHRLDDAEQRESQRTFSGSCSSNDSNLKNRLANASRLTLVGYKDN